MTPPVAESRILAIKPAELLVAPSSDSQENVGVSLAGTTGADSEYTVEGASVSSPSVGTASRPPPLDQRLSEKRVLAQHLAGPEREDVRAPVEVPENEPVDPARVVLYAGSLQLAVFDVAQAKQTIEDALEVAGGYVQRMEGNSMVLRIPAPKFRPVIDELSTMGRVDYFGIESLDVTEEYEDLQTRIEVLRRTHSQLLELLDQAATVEEALEVRKQLDAVTLELERALGRQRWLDSRQALSTLALVLTERGIDGDLPSSNDPFPWVDSIGLEATLWR